MRTKDKMLLMIFLVLLVATTASIAFNNSDNYDIVFRSFLSLLIGYMTSSSYLSMKKTTTPRVKDYIIGGIGLYCVLVLVGAKYVGAVGDQNVVLVRDIASGCIGWLLGKEH